MRLMGVVVSTIFKQSGGESLSLAVLRLFPLKFFVGRDKEFCPS
jgi:hypothetical protein